MSRLFARISRALMRSWRADHLFIRMYSVLMRVPFDQGRLVQCSKTWSYNFSGCPKDPNVSWAAHLLISRSGALSLESMNGDVHVPTSQFQDSATDTCGARRPIPRALGFHSQLTAWAPVSARELRSPWNCLAYVPRSSYLKFLVFGVVGP